MAILCDTIFNFTQLGVSPRYSFDADKAVGNNQAVIQHWARSAFLGSERQLITCICRTAFRCPSRNS